MNGKIVYSYLRPIIIDDLVCKQQQQQQKISGHIHCLDDNDGDGDLFVFSQMVCYFFCSL